MRENRTQKSDAESGSGARLDVSRVLTEYRGLLCYIIRSIVGDENLIEDCFSEISEIIIQKYDAYYDENKGSLTAWLTKVARNGALNFIKKRKHQILAGSEEAATVLERRGDAAEDHDAPEAFLIRRENLQELAAALQGLRESEKKLILRRYYYMQPMAQIAAETGMSLRAAEGKLYRIKKKLLADIERQRKGGSTHVE